MKQHRTSLQDDSQPRLAGVRDSAALRERLTQTRARIARAQPPQIQVDWDSEEPPTRLWQGRALLSARSSASRSHQSARAIHPEVHARREAPATSARAQLHPPSPSHAPVDQAATITPSVTAQKPEVHTPIEAPAPIAPLSAGGVLSAVRARVNRAYGSLDRSDAALRRRVAYCSLALLVVAASSRMLFGGQSGTRVILTLAPSDARVSLDGEALSGETNPHVLEGVASGEHALTIEKTGFVAQHHKLTLGAGELERPITLKLTPALRNADVSISSDPPGALIILNGQTSRQVTPAKLTDLAPGRHLIGLKLAGYADAKEALSLPHDALVSIKLASLSEPRFVEEAATSRALTRVEQRANARALARERRAAARAAKVLLRYRARMGLPPDPVAQELVDAYAPVQPAE